MTTLVATSFLETQNICHTSKNATRVFRDYNGL